MNHVAQAVAAIRKSPAFALMLDNEPVTVAALQKDIDALDRAWDLLDDELELATKAQDDGEIARIKTEIASMEITYIEAWEHLDTLRAAIAADNGLVH